MDKAYYPEVDLITDFNVIVETCTRMGILSKKNLVYQTCHIFHTNGKYYIPHFKELFSVMDFKINGKVDESKIHMSDDDFERRNTIIYLMSSWELIKPKDPEYIESNKGNQKIFVVPFKQKIDYVLISKFTLGKR